MFENEKKIALSNFPKNSKYHTNDNIKATGKMKDEYGGKVIYDLHHQNQNRIQ